MEAFPPSFSFLSFSTRSFLTCGSVNIVTPGPLLALSSQRCPPSSRLQNLAPHICSVPTFLAASVPPGAGPPETGASARDSGLEEVSKSRSRDPELPVSGPGCGVVRLKARPNSSSQSLPPHIRPDMHQIYTKSHASATSQIRVTIWGGRDQVLKHLNSQGTFPIQSIAEIILPYNQRCVGRLCTEKRQFLLFGLLLQICHLGRSCDFINTALARKAQSPVCGDILRVI